MSLQSPDTKLIKVGNKSVQHLSNEKVKSRDCACNTIPRSGGDMPLLHIGKEDSTVPATRLHHATK
jgi:hypothetical protein